MSLRKALAYIKRNNNFLITTHTNMEGDALGSALAFYRMVRKLGKHATVISDDVIPYGYEFLPGVNNIKRPKKTSVRVKFDSFVTLDCSDINRCGQVYRLNTNNLPILNIDHHISNARFGDVNWVDPKAASCTEMVFGLYKKLRLPLDKEIATLLYVGILTDTGSFHYTNTTRFTHRIASELLKYNLNISRIYKNIYENIPFDDLKLLNTILTGIKLSNSGKVAWFQIRRGTLENKKILFDLSEQILNFGRAVKGVEVVALFKENLKDPNQIRVNLRSQGKVDVNKVATYFGGGGHKTASGITISGNIRWATEKVLRKIKDSLK